MLHPTLVNGTRRKHSALPFQLIEHDLSECERIFDEALTPFKTRFGPIVNHLKHYRGKRLRPALLLLAGYASGNVTRAHHILGAVVELVHTATLVHDDVLDEASTRRHVRTVNSLWGDRTSLLLGDMLFSAAFRLCSTVDAIACEWIGDATNRVCAGELLQVSQAGNLGLPEEIYFEIVAGKTGALTECCTRLGARYAGADDRVTGMLARYGRDLGIAFQIADDVLDLQGNETTAGKTLGTDIEQQKLTLPMIRAFAELSDEEGERLRTALRSGRVAEASNLISSTGAIESVIEEARGMMRAARNGLSILPVSPYRVALDQLADWSIRRER